MIIVPMVSTLLSLAVRQQSGPIIPAFPARKSPAVKEGTVSGNSGLHSPLHPSRLRQTRSFTVIV